MNNQNETSLTASTKQLSEMLGISIKQVGRLESRGQLPKHIYIGGSRKWVRSEIISWLEHRAPDTPEWEAIKDGMGRKEKAG